MMRAGLLLILAAATAAAQRAPTRLPGRPVTPPPAPLVYPKVVYDSLPNGLRYAVVEQHELPMVVVQASFAGQGPFGTWFMDSPEKPGAWGLMLSTLREGTRMRSSSQINDEVLDLGTDMRFTSGIAFGAPGFRSARSTWLASLDILADVMVNPTFPEAGFKRVQNSLAGSFDRLSALTLANRIMMTALYGAESPSTRYPSGASLRALTRDDMVAIHQQLMRPQNTMLVVAGDISVAEARAALMKSFGGWVRGGTTATQVVPAAPSSPAPTTIYLKDTPGAPLAFVVAGQILPGRDHPDAMPIQATAALLGDFSFSAGSRVYTAFRIERGLSYSPRVELPDRPVPETVPLYATFQTAAEVADTAVMVYLKVLRDLRTEKPATEGELDFSRRAMVGRVASNLERVDGLASNVLQTMRDRLPPDYVSRWTKAVTAVTLPEVRAASAKYLDPDHTVIVVAADRSKVEAALRATGIPVVIVP